MGRYERNRPSMRTPTRPLLSAALVTVTALSASAAHAQDRRQFRRLELTDGRRLTAEILATESTGILLRTPQGKSLISFEILRDMSPTDQSTYNAQDTWKVYLDLPPHLEGDALELLGAIEGVRAAKVGQTAFGVTPEMAADARACEGSVGCIADATAAAPWMWVVAATETEPGAIRSTLNSGGSKHTTELASESRDGLWGALHEAIGLEPPSGGAPRATKSKGGGGGGGAFSREKVAALSLVPLPGLPSMAMGDGGNAGLAWGLALPITGAFAGASVAAASDNPGEMVGMMAGGFYVATVFANQVTGMRSLQKQGVALVPMSTEHGGGVAVAGRLR